LYTLAITATGVLAAVLIYGVVRLSTPLDGKKLKISLIQGNIPQAHKWQPQYAQKIMDVYTALTREAMKEGPDLIVWPEAATPKPISVDRLMYRHVKMLSDEADAYILLGSSSHQKFKLQENIKIKFRNSAFFLGPGGQVKDQRYDKIHLLPFGEYLPHKDIIPWSWINIPDVPTTLAGKSFTVFQCPEFQLSAPICWETVFPYMIRNMVRNGAQFIVNITNEAWFGDTAAPYHFLSSNVFRAVENRIYMVRCGNTGVSCFIDPHGKIVNRVEDKNGRDIFVRGVLTDTIILMDNQTAYTRYGDLFAWVCLVCSIMFLIVGLIHERRFFKFK
jgi:apolipoprotein N-acyltransferase